MNRPFPLSPPNSNIQTRLSAVGHRRGWTNSGLRKHEPQRLSISNNSEPIEHEHASAVEPAA
jgi:hypothetical protein